MIVHVGATIKKVRKSKKITLVELSKSSGVQLATLSRIENGIMTGTLESHINIAKALEISLIDLYKELPQVKKTVEVGTDKEREAVFVHNKRSASEMLASKISGKKMMPVLVTVQKGGSTHKEETKHGIEKFIYVLDGKIEGFIGENTYELKKGDTLYFEACLPHYFKNTGTSDAKLISVTCPPVW